MSTLPPDPYKILGVSKDAQLAEIRSRYRKLVLQCHPDKIQDPVLKEAKQAEFQQVQQAYELLINENERGKYDQKAEIFAELARERERASNVSTTRTTASSRTPRRETVFVNIKEASPRSTTFAKSSPYGRTPPRSWEDASSGARLYDDSRHARKSASYEKEKPSRRDGRDEERRRQKEEDDYFRERQKDKEARRAAKEKAEKERLKDLKAKEEKDRRREDKAREEKEKVKELKKKAEREREKEREKERKHASAEKTRTRHAYQAPVAESSDESPSDDDDVIYEPPPSKDRKKSGSGRQVEEPETDHLPAVRERQRKYSGNMDNAVRYLERSGAKVPASLGRSQTFTEASFSSKFAQPIAVPTPPPALNAPFVPPPPKAVEATDSEDSDMVQRSSARPAGRRMSHDTPKSSGGRSHKKSSSSRDHPVVVESGSPRMPPGLHKSYSEHVPSLLRSQTDTFATRPVPISMSRAETWYPSTEHDRERHERSRSRPSKIYQGEETDDDREQRRQHRSRRTHSPEPIQPIHYKVGKDGKTQRQKSYYPQETSSRYQSSKNGAYIVPHSSSSRRKGPSKSYSRDYDEPLQAPFSNVKYASQFDAKDISYSPVQHSSSYRSSTGVY